MVQLRHREQLDGKMPANREILNQRRELVTQLGTISSLIEQNIQDLSQPMTIILGLGELILPQTEAGSDLAADLMALSKQVRRMSQIVAEVNDLVEQRKKLLKVLGTLSLSTTSPPGHYSAQEE